MKWSEKYQVPYMHNANICRFIKEEIFEIMTTSALDSCKPVSNHEKWEITRIHPQKYELNYAWSHSSNRRRKACLSGFKKKLHNI